MTLSNDNDKLVAGIDPAKPRDDRSVESIVEAEAPRPDPLGGVPVDHVLIPNDEIVLAQCAFCKKPAAGAVEVKDPAKPEAQVFIKACNTHKDKAMRKAASVLRRYYKKRVVIDGTPEHIKRMGAGDKKIRPDDGVVTK